jgi:Ni/Fe-hydrogenase subunit HybB-like protein
MAGVSGVGLLIIIAAARAPCGKEQLGQTFRWLGNFLLVLVAAYLYFMMVEPPRQPMPPRGWSGPSRMRCSPTIRLALLAVGCAAGRLLFMLLGQFILHRYSLALIVLSGIFVNVAAIGKRYLIVVPSQTHGMLLPYETGSYAPTWVEYAIILGLIALGVLLFLLFMKVFPIMELHEPAEGGAQ